MKRTVVLVCATIGAILVSGARNFAQDQPEKTAQPRRIQPWTGTPEMALVAARSGATIPLSTYSILPSKENGNKKLTGTIVGTSPFSSPLSGSVINAVVVPLIFDIEGTIFDPTTPNACDSGYSAITRFNLSPLVQPVPNLSFNGVYVGNVQYTDGFMRAQFWNVIGGNPAYTNPIDFSTAAPITITTGANGITYSSGCTLLGIVSQTFLDTQIASALKSLTQSGVVSTTKLVLFLTSNVVGSSTSPPSPYGSSGCCNWGGHAATGNPPQFYIFADYKTTPLTYATDVNIASHELAEFMNDPLGSNPTPAWGGIGTETGCSGVLEVGDPLTAVRLPITLNGFTYQPQELAFFSWFFNSPATPSLGAGGLFSSNGSFTGPSRSCPPGGTY